MVQVLECAGKVRELAEDHVRSDVTREVGGVLVGHIAEGTTSVTAVIPALKAVGATSHVTFTHDVWEDVLATLDRDHSGSKIVGWYHSHPGFGLFLSEYDKFAHDNFFPDPGMTALVIDPIAGEGGWFFREGDDLQLTGEFKVAPVARPTSVGTSSTPTLAPRILAGAGVLLLGFVVGFVYRGPGQTQPRQNSADSTQLAEALASNADLRHRIELLKASSTPASNTEPPHTYVVKRGDTLWAIAERELGSGYEWPKIARVNHIKPLAIYDGLELIIPQDPEATGGIQ
jgi:proteasome lid subunit RPN8/RPN11/LysM repeat protein